MYVYGSGKKRSDAVSCTKRQAARLIKDILSGRAEKQAKHLTISYNK